MGPTKRMPDRDHAGVKEERRPLPLIKHALVGFWSFSWVPVICWIEGWYASGTTGFWTSVLAAHARGSVCWLFDLAPFLGAFLSVWSRLKVERLEGSLQGVAEARDRAEADYLADKQKIELRRQEFDRLAELHRAAARRFEELFQGLPVACFTYDRSGLLFECNRALETLWATPAAKMQQKPVNESIWSTGDLEQWRALNERVFAGETIYQVELWFPNVGGSGKWILFSSIPLRSMQDDVVAAIASLMDITDRKAMEQRISDQISELNLVAEQLAGQKRELEVANERLALQATTDGLTGVANRRLFREVLDRACQEAGPEHPYSLVMLDVDHFKSYNDTFGHQAGDDLLKLIADHLKAAIRPNDFAARFGGEEFVLLLPGSDAAQAHVVAERIRAQLQGLEQACCPVSASFGIATIALQGADPRAFLEQADAAMYVSKRCGRNQVTHWDDISADTARAA